jgi:hypothetical protein
MSLVYIKYYYIITAIMLLIVILLFAYRTGNGPLWQEIIYPSVSKCRENWWAHALYISNFIPGKNMVSNNSDYHKKSQEYNCYSSLK